MSITGKSKSDRMVNRMKKMYMVSLCRQGILGGWIIADDEGITYKTGKVTVSPKLRNLEMKYRDIRNFSRAWMACFPTVTVTMADGESYIFIVFRPGSFCRLLENRIGGQSS